VNVALSNKIKHQLQRELVKRELIRYFALKGYENFDSPLYPPTCADLPIVVKHLFNRTEVVPYSESVDVSTGIHKIGWNLFVLGTNRLHLGYTSHSSANDVLRATRGEANSHFPAEMVTTPNNCINFVLKILDNSRNGYIELPPNFQLPMGAITGPLFKNSQRSPRIGPTASGAFYAR